MNQNESKIRFGIVGCGVIASTHAAAIAQIKSAELVAACDVIPTRAQSLADQFAIPKVFSKLEEMLADRDIDAISICTPSGLHGEHTVAALRARKHVIVEKPMEITMARCDQIIAAARESGKVLTVVSQHRFDSASQLVKELIDSGRLGNIFLATADVKWWRTQEYYDSGDWRGTWKLDGGGALMNQGVHTVDLLQWLVGKVESVSAHTSIAAHERIEVEDAAVATLRFKNGAIGTIVASTAAYDGLPVRIEIFGTEGTAIIEGDRLKLVRLKSGETFASEQAAAHALRVAKGGTASVKDEPSLRPASANEGAVWGDAHRAQLEDFIHAIRNDKQPLLDAESARHAVEIILGIYQSARESRPVVLSQMK